VEWLGLDVGGANLKVADCREYSNTIRFPLWRQPDDLEEQLRQLIERAPVCDAIAVTMTGELADCFETKTDGVLHILHAVEHAACGRRVRVYCVDGAFLPGDAVRSEPLLAAASNWHALARYVGRWVEHFPAMLVDVGSTTTDIVLLTKNGPQTSSTTDTQRLLSGELVYSGIGRTSIAAITSILPYRGGLCPVAAETFAASVDAAVLLGMSPERPSDNDTADGRPLTKDCCRDRLARMLCADRSEFTPADALQAARFVWEQQTAKISRGIKQVVEASNFKLASVLLSGSGELLAKAAVESLLQAARTRRLSAILGSELSTAAPAHAVAVLASEQEHAS
jgi:probable H4MPT-linked C1 transfer pathway protein